MLKVKLNLDNHNDWKIYSKIIEIVVNYGIFKESELTENNCPQIANNIYNDFLDNSGLSFNFTNLEDFIITDHMVSKYALINYDIIKIKNFKRVGNEIYYHTYDSNLNYCVLDTDFRIGTKEIVEEYLQEKLNKNKLEKQRIINKIYKYIDINSIYSFDKKLIDVLAYDEIFLDDVNKDFSNYLNDISNKIREYMKVFNTGFLEAYNEVIH